VVPPYNPFARSARGIADFEIGQNASCNPDQKVHYCNGPLKSGRTYYIKIRAFTDEDKYSETAYVAFATDQDNTWLVYTLVIPFSLAVIFIVCLVYVRRRRNGTFGKRAKGIGHGDTVSLQESIIDTR
jgi:receptor-type tyrosine-protein phosphatase beta